MLLGKMDSPRLPQWPVGLLCLLALVIALVLNAQQKETRGLRTGGACALLLAGSLLIGAAGCGGGGATAPSAAIAQAPQAQTVTPKGTSVLMLEAQSGSLPQQTLQLTLTVN